MRNLGAVELKESLDYTSIVDTLDAAYRAAITVPARSHLTVPVAGEADMTMLVMPAWDASDFIGIKLVNVAPDNAKRRLPSVQATYQLFSRVTGEPVALIDGTELTARKTAASSALASRYLSCADASSLLMVGTGVLAPHLINAHATVRPINRVRVWGRNSEKAAAVAGRLEPMDASVDVVTNLDAAVLEADIISTATLATEPLIRGELLRAGQHLDLVGAFTPDMREADDDCVTRARLYIDTEEAIKKTGEICDPITRGVSSEKDIVADMFAVVRGEAQGRGGRDEITLFKSAGSALLDLATAALAYERA